MSRRDWPTAEYHDIEWHDAPTLVMWTHDGQQLRYPLTPLETYRLVRRLVGYLGMMHEKGHGE